MTDAFQRKRVTRCWWQRDGDIAGEHELCLAARSIAR